MSLDLLLGRIAGFGERTALVDRSGGELTYRQLAEDIEDYSQSIRSSGIRAGDVAAVEVDFSRETISCLVAAWKCGIVTALVPPGSGTDPVQLEATLASALINPAAKGHVEMRLPQRRHPLLEQMRNTPGGGFVILTSGSTGKPKAALHATARFLLKFTGPGKALSTLCFLSLDHVAGVDTLLYTLSAGGTLVVPPTRDPDQVCRCIAENQVEVLPVSPSFIRLLLISGALTRHDLRSLKIVTYGSEPMDETTLERLGEVLPGVRVIQKYGTTEFGAPRARSRGDTSTWLNIKSDETEYRIVDGRLWIRSPSSMLGYLNAQTPLDADGWLDTGDLVEVDGDWIRIVGRDADVINVGGEKVMPAEVETVIESFPGVLEAVVHGEPHPVMGQVPCATIFMESGANTGRSLRNDIRRHCRAHLDRHKVPVRIAFATQPLHNERHKKQRGGAG